MDADVRPPAHSDHHRPEVSILVGAMEIGILPLAALA